MVRVRVRCLAAVQERKKDALICPDLNPTRTQPKTTAQVWRCIVLQCGLYAPRARGVESDQAKCID